MTATQALAELKRCGTAQNRKVYARHGVGAKLFGVSFADLRRLAKRIKKDHDLALRLWDSGNHDARMLALMVADSERVTRRELDEWVCELDNYVLTDQLVALAASGPHRQAKMEKWTKSKGEWRGRAGWGLLARIALDVPDVPDASLEKQLVVIEKEIHARPNRVRDAMNNALIAIGARNAKLRRKAVAAARRIGKVHVDHGETGCKTPDAVAYIDRMLAHRAKKKE